MNRSSIFAFGFSIFTLFHFASAYADVNTTIRTPRRTVIPAILRDFELSQREIEASDNFTRRTYPLATLERSASRRYNCHSYAWYSQAAANNIWLNDEDPYWTDGSYVLIQQVNGGINLPANVPNGSKLSWLWNDHSAIKVDAATVRSKWGPGPQMRHHPGDSPYSCKQCSFPLKAYRLSN
jgi:hypothetical protein